MGEDSKIEWTTHTFSAWIGCHKVSPGCKHCYAAVDTFARVSRARGLELWGVDAERHVTSDAYWKKPIKWNREAEKAGERHRVFCSSLSDVFEDRADLKPHRARLAKLIVATPHLDWLLLTKRPENAARLWKEACPFEGNNATEEEIEDLACVCGEHSCADGWAPNIWLGTTAEDQENADARIAHLTAIDVAVRFLSCEPLLGDIDLRDALHEEGYESNGPAGHVMTREHGIDWVIVGGESGSHARSMDLAWMRSIVAQCRRSHVPVFCKQLGAKPYMEGSGGERFEWPCGWSVGDSPTKHEPHDCATWLKLKDEHGGDMTEWPIDLRVREFPARGEGEL